MLPIGGRTSHEVRGLKFKIGGNCIQKNRSHLTRGAWIEILDIIEQLKKKNVAPHTRCVDWNVQGDVTDWKPIRRTSHEVRGLKCLWHLRCQWCRLSHLTRGAWIEMQIQAATILAKMSHLTRGAWIEILSAGDVFDTLDVAPHTRCVDWNARRGMTAF